MSVDSEDDWFGAALVTLTADDQMGQDQGPVRALRSMNLARECGLEHLQAELCNISDWASRQIARQTLLAVVAGGGGRDQILLESFQS